ncbi:hypothetical protein GPECTOR_65g182 [Gonium pectorale]|uniref:Coenzyme Q-binding protein COQ10 START domain-containing protein n=1 Tax=Gonium pectorale TaxID=33097 RepID=A0A150G410_GONPE|nr:hypothetical protein GPECTOR_65g182 [Gonium pectorale]|eukprot:KXZ44564.1 hypothetical protein GPECTOR_65g182 [Gonium pectorale]
MVGAQDVAMGVKFSAAVTLRCCEFPEPGLPEGRMTAPPPTYSAASAGSSSDGAEGVESLFPFPATSVPGVAPSDITFELVEGDFQSFRGVWRMQQTGDQSTLLSYALFVKPQAWLPVALIQGRIENEVLRNLEAVSRYSESQFQRARK